MPRQQKRRAGLGHGLGLRISAFTSQGPLRPSSIWRISCIEFPRATTSILNHVFKPGRNPRARVGSIMTALAVKASENFPDIDYREGLLCFRSQPCRHRHQRLSHHHFPSMTAVEATFTNTSNKWNKKPLLQLQKTPLSLYLSVPFMSRTFLLPATKEKRTTAIGVSYVSPSLTVLDALLSKWPKKIAQHVYLHASMPVIFFSYTQKAHKMMTCKPAWSDYGRPWCSRRFDDSSQFFSQFSLPVPLDCLFTAGPKISNESATIQYSNQIQQLISYFNQLKCNMALGRSQKIIHIRKSDEMEMPNLKENLSQALNANCQKCKTFKGKISYMRPFTSITHIKVQSSWNFSSSIIVLFKFFGTCIPTSSARP